MAQMDALTDLKEKCDKYRRINPNSYVSQIDDSIGGKVVQSMNHEYWKRKEFCNFIAFL